MRSSRGGDQVAVGRLLRGAACLLAGLATGCATRHHTNPFDPENPSTHGRPALLQAVAGDGRVDLTWRRERLDDLVGYRLSRRDAAGGVRVLAESLDAAVTTWSDTAATNDSTYDYVLEVAFAGGIGRVETPAATATPGRRVIWLLEGRGGNPVRIAPDGRDVVARFGDGAPGRCDAEPATGGVVTGEVGAEGLLQRWSPAGVKEAEAAFPRFQALAVVGGGAGVWVTGVEPGRLVHLAEDLRTILSDDTLDANLLEVAVDRRTGDVWASDVDNGRVFHRHKDGGLTAVTDFSLPVSLAVDPRNGDCWVADRRAGQVVRVDGRADTVLVRAEGFVAPLDLAADPLDGGVWVTDAGRGALVRLGPDGGEVARVTGFGRPYGVALEPGGAEIWLTDAQAGELLRLGRDGGRRERLTGLFSPFAVVVALPAAR